MGFEVIALIALTLFAQFVKGYLYPKFGKYAVHAVMFIVAMLITGVWQAMNANEDIMQLVLQAGTLLVQAVGIYEVVLKRIGFTSITETLQKKS